MKGKGVITLWTLCCSCFRSGTGREMFKAHKTLTHRFKDLMERPMCYEQGSPFVTICVVLMECEGGNMLPRTAIA